MTNNDKALVAPPMKKTQADHIATLQLYVKDLKNDKLWKGDSGLVAAIEALTPQSSADLSDLRAKVEGMRKIMIMGESPYEQGKRHGNDAACDAVLSEIDKMMKAGD